MWSDNLGAVLTHVSLMVNDVVCFHVMYLLPIRIPSWKNVYWGVSFACLKIRFSFYYWDVRVFIFSKFKFLIRYMICKYFLPFCGLTFTFWSLKHKSFKFWWSPVYRCFFCCLCNCLVYLRNHYPSQNHEGLFLWFFQGLYIFKSFIILG